MSSSSAKRLTHADLVLLSLFMERAWYGYELSAELERREAADWASGVSRPQIYYSLKKLADNFLVAPVEAGEENSPPAAIGPERQVYAITEAGRAAFLAGLDRPEWATLRTPPPFLTWLALSPHAPHDVVERMIDGRAAHLDKMLAREREHLRLVGEEAGFLAPVADLMVRHTISAYESEIAWLREVRRVLLGKDAVKDEGQDAQSV